MATHASRDTTTGLVFEKNTPINQIFKDLVDDGAIMFANTPKMAEETGMLYWREYVNNLSGLTFVGTGNGKHPTIWHKNYIPDGAIIYNNVLYIIEKKYQQCSGSADEKLTYGEFRRTRFEKLAEYFPIEIKDVKYLYILGKWFKKEHYMDVIEHERKDHPKVEFMFYDENPSYDFFKE